MNSPRKNILETIVEQKRIEVASLPQGTGTLDAVRDAVAHCGPRRDFFGALRGGADRPVTLIAEVKKASPSKGVIRADFDPVRIAREYEAGGASCLSVLTDEKFFQGRLEYLKAIREAVRLPLLRKDFMIDERQVAEAVEWGADAILLIVAILSDEQIRSLLRLAEAGGVAALVEVHDEAEMDRAVASGAKLIGVNNRNLKTFEVDLGTTERLAARLRSSGGEGCHLVGESGIYTREDVLRLGAAGAGSILVGESLMRERSVREKIRELLGAGG